MRQLLIAVAVAVFGALGAILLERSMSNASKVILLLNIVALLSNPLVIVVSAWAIAVGALWWFLLPWLGTSPEEVNDTASEAQLFVDCQSVLLPISVSPDSRLYSLDVFPSLLGGLTQYLFGPDVPTAHR